MHEALRLYDILELIFSFNNSRSDMAALLRTCKTFEEPARARLWQKMPHLLVLARITKFKAEEGAVELPSENISEENQNIRPDNTISQPPENEARMILYASYIKAICLDLGETARYFPDSGVDPAEIAALAFYIKTNRQLFPKLHTVYYLSSRVPTSCLSAVHSIFKATLQYGVKKVYLSMQDQSSRITTQRYRTLELLSLSGCEKTLRTLCIMSRRNDELLSNIHSEVITSLPVLLNLDTQLPIDLDGLSRLALLPCLRSLRLVLSSEMDIPTSLPLLTLENLSLTASLSSLHVPKAVPLFLKAMLSPKLHSLRLAILSFELRFSPEAARSDRYLTDAVTILAASGRGALRHITFDWHTQTSLFNPIQSSTLCWVIAAPLLEQLRIGSLRLPLGSCKVSTAEEAMRLTPLLRKLGTIWMPVLVSLKAFHTVASQSSLANFSLASLILILPDEDLAKLSPLLHIQRLSVVSQSRIQERDLSTIANNIQTQFPSLRRLVTYDKSPFVSNWQTISEQLNIPLICEKSV